MQRMARLSDTAKTTLQRRVAAHHAQHWPQLSSLDVRWRGSYAYIDATTPGGEVWRLCRLKWNGHHDHWEFAIYLASRDTSLGRAGGAPDCGAGGWVLGVGTHVVPEARRPALRRLGCVVPKARPLALCGVRPGACGVSPACLAAALGALELRAACSVRS